MNLIKKKHFGKGKDGLALFFSADYSYYQNTLKPKPVQPI